MSRKSYWDTDRHYSQPSTEQIKRNAAQTAKKAVDKGKTLCPVMLSGRTIAKSWWGKAWCENLERYADYESRLSRGQRYVRSGAVVDLQIEKGKILARVQGSRKTPYKVEIRISPLSEERCNEIMNRCSCRVDTMEHLIGGSFPVEMKDIFLSKDGLFPNPKEISFRCSCPDWALMCKHVAAALYGVGARLDEDPTMFFTLRGIDTTRFVDVVIANRIEAMLSNAGNPSDRIMDGADLTSLFGVV
ncbi:MAG: hypothetical protein E7434_02785 [Ruminococcaceae bacterium]|nr:hypothetical protein [Oscillospiraceae bacterium]